MAAFAASAPPLPPPAWRPLPIPPLAAGRVGRDRVRRFALVAGQGVTEVLPGRPTTTWGFSQSVLGPTLRARRGETVSVEVTNTLRETLTVHWHGMHLPPTVDGGPHQLIAPGTQWNPSWTMRQPAATLWYHPHTHGSTAHQAFHGLAGLFLVDDAAGDALDLPHDYGRNDIPLILQDAKFTANGDIDDGKPKFGNVVTTNGQYRSVLTVAAGLVRLRIVNAAANRFMNLGFADNTPFHMIGSDGGLLARPVPLRRLQLTPGERAEVVVSVPMDRDLLLRDFAFPDHDGMVDNNDYAETRVDDVFDVLLVRGTGGPPSQIALPDTLVRLPDIDTTGAPNRIFDLGADVINKATLDMDRIDFTTTVGTPEIWSIHNVDNFIHSFHVHGSHFRVIDVDGRPPPGELSGLKDTVNVPAGHAMRLAVRFDDYSDTVNPYMFHCHVMEHEDEGMMGQFLVLPKSGVPRATAR